MADVWLVHVSIYGPLAKGTFDEARHKRSIYEVRVFSTESLARFYAQKVLDEWEHGEIVWVSPPDFIKEVEKFEWTYFEFLVDHSTHKQRCRGYILLQHEAVDHMVSQVEIETIQQESE